MKQHKTKVISSMEFGNHLIERLESESGYYYLIDRVPVVSDADIMELSDDKKEKVCHAADTMWQPEFIMLNVDGQCKLGLFVKPYVYFDKHVRITGGLVHYDSANMPFSDDVIHQEAEAIAKMIHSSACGIWCKNGHIRSNFLEQSMWSQEMHQIFDHIEGELSCRM